MRGQRIPVGTDLNGRAVIRSISPAGRDSALGGMAADVPHAEDGLARLNATTAAITNTEVLARLQLRAESLAPSAVNTCLSLPFWAVRAATSAVSRIAATAVRLKACDYIGGQWIPL